MEHRPPYSSVDPPGWCCRPSDTAGQGTSYQVPDEHVPSVSDANRTLLTICQSGDSTGRWGVEGIPFTALLGVAVSVWHQKSPRF